MTGPVTTEALVEALAPALWQIRIGLPGGLPANSWEETLRASKALPGGQAAWDVARIKGEASAILAGPLAPLLASHQQVTAERDEARATDRESVRKRLIEAHEQLCKIDADGDLPVRARDKNPPDTLRSVAERAVRMLEEIRAEDAAKGRPWWAHTLAKFALDDLVYALAELPDPEASLAAANAELARLRAEGEALKADRDDAIRMLDVWFDTSTKTNEQVVPQLVDALVGYLRTCRCGGMPAETSDMIEAGAADFIRRRAGYIIAPVIEAMVAERTASLRAEGEARDRALKAKAEEQVAYWRKRQEAEKSPEDGISEDGETYTPIGDVAAWQGGYCNGRMSEADWWLKTLQHWPNEAARAATAREG